MRTFIALNLHLLADSKVQLNTIKVHICESTTLGRSYQRRQRDDGKAMANRLLKTGFKLFAEDFNSCCIMYIVGKFIPNLRSIKYKNIAKYI